MIKRYTLDLIFLCLIFVPAMSWSADKIQGNACYTYGDNESLVQAEQTAKTLAIRNAIESYSVFIESKTKVKNYETMSDVINSVSAEQVQNVKILKRTQSERTICYTVRGYVNPEKLKKAITNYYSGINSDVQLQDNGYFRIIGEPFLARYCYHLYPSDKKEEFIVESDDEKLNDLEREKRGFKKEECLLRFLSVHLQFMKPCIATTTSSGDVIKDIKEIKEISDDSFDAFVPRFRCDYRFKLFITLFSDDGKTIETVGEYPRAYLIGEKFDKQKIEKSPGEKISHIFYIPENAKSWKVWVPK